MLIIFNMVYGFLYNIILYVPFNFYLNNIYIVYGPIFNDSNVYLFYSFHFFLYSLRIMIILKPFNMFFILLFVKKNISTYFKSVILNL